MIHVHLLSEKKISKTIFRKNHNLFLDTFHFLKNVFIRGQNPAGTFLTILL